MLNGEDFSAEIEQIRNVLEIRREQLQNCLPNTPHPNCSCGKTLNEHLEEDITSLVALQSMLEGNVAPMEELMILKGRQYFVYSLANLYREHEDMAQRAGVAGAKIVAAYLSVQAFIELPPRPEDSISADLN